VPGAADRAASLIVHARQRIPGGFP